MIIAIIQQHASSDNEDNLKRGLIAIDKASEQGAELAVFAELAFTRFFPQKHASGSVSHLSEKVPGPTTRAFMEKAKEHGMVIVINLFEEADNKTYDSSPVIDANGTLLGSTRMVHIADYDCFFEKNVKATDGKTVILSENLDLLASEDIATIYNNVRLNAEKGLLRADKVEYDFEKKFYRISMFDDTRVKIKLIK